MIKTIAFYLPQYHPIPENNQWWGEGFTEWTNVKKAQPLFPGHHQPVKPGELGYYDLRDPQIRMKQAELAKSHGIYGFCYWHYWFGNGETLLEKPFNEVLESGRPDFPFCLGWANESWTGIWHGSPDKVLMKQRYPGREDVKEHFQYLLRAFQDERYIKINNKPFFLVYKPGNLPDARKFTELFNELAIKNGFNGIHFVATNVSLSWDREKFGFNAIVPPYHHRIVWEKNRGIRSKIARSLKMGNKEKTSEPKNVYRYKDALKYFLPDKIRKNEIYPMVVPNWDSSPRSGKRAVIFTDSTPRLFEKHVRKAVKLAKENSKPHQILMIKSWNEWAEGNYLEPDQKWGRAYLEVFKKVMDENNSV